MIGQLISLGIGSPASVTMLLAVGLSMGAAPQAGPSQLISLGIGSPASVTTSLLSGLSMDAAEVPPEGPSQVISLGIGSPASITAFLLFGLSMPEPIVYPTIVRFANVTATFPSITNVTFEPD